MQNSLINNTSIVKTTNIELVRNYLRRSKTATRAEIADATGLSVATSGNILREMLADKEVFEYGMEDSKGGRPARRYEYNENFIQVACIGIFYDSGVKSIRYAIANSFGEIIERESNCYDTVDYGTVNNIVKSILSNYPNVQALTISIPGISYKGIIRVCDIKELESVPLQIGLSEEHGIIVAVEGITEVTALGYYNANPEFEGKSIAVLIAPQNLYLGAGIISNGILIKGDQHMAGEVSFISGGMRREEALANMAKHDFFINSLTTSITAIISVINPSKIVVTGDAVSKHPDVAELVLQKCRELIPDIFMPDIEVIEDTESYFSDGIISMALNHTTSGIKLVQNRL